MKLQPVNGRILVKPFEAYNWSRENPYRKAGNTKDRSFN